MKRWTAAACALAAGALSVVTAGTAAAQYPGANGPVISYSADGPDNAPCMDLYGDELGAVAFSKDNLHMATAGQPDVGDNRLFVYDLTTCARHQIGVSDPHSTLSFSPDGKQLAVAQAGDIHVVSAVTGTLVRNLTPNLTSTTERNPTWDPLGRYISYDASDGVRRRPATGGASKLMVAGATHSDFSPDGKYLAYIDSMGKVDYSDAVTAAVVRKTAMLTDKVSLAWSPDGKAFAFTATDRTTGEYYCVTGTTGSTILTRDHSNDFCQTQAWRRT